jgi:myo-inositol-1(or 4)-monophosphatase
MSAVAAAVLDGAVTAAQPYSFPQPADPSTDGLVGAAPAELAALAERVARGAGEVVRRLRAEAAEGGEPADQALDITTKSNDTDLVTAADKASERYITERLLAARPPDGLLGEEGADRAGTSGIRWVIDPIDGTVNYVLGLPHHSVSIAAQRDGQTIAAAVHAVGAGRTYAAALGGGAFADGRVLRGPRDLPLSQAVLGTGVAYDAALRGRQGAALAQVLPRVANLRRLGSAALDLCLLGDGQLDAFYEFGINDWDVAAGLLIAAEAGARTSGLRGRPAAAPFVAATGARAAQEFFALLESVGADRVG